jgi:cysteine synthase
MRARALTAHLDNARADRVRRRVAELLERHPRSVLTSIGGTDLLELSRSNATRARVFAKVEGQNPAGSIKDRLALYLVADAIERGGLGPNTVLVEASSGNTGIGLAMVGARLGLRVLITIPANVSEERHQLIRSYGAELLITPGSEGTSGAIERARELGATSGYFWVSQHFNEVNTLAHYETTGAEIVAGLQAANAPVPAAFVATSGTTGTLMGISLRLREAYPGVKVVSVWPSDRIMGIRKPIGDNRPTIYDESLIDEVLEVSNDEALKMVKTVAYTEGIFAGPSGGAAVVGALQVAARLGEAPRGCVVTLLPDWGERYLSVF